ncbi:MAG: GspH/FimT family pseudopilin [Acidiferrobacterales bacterium]
MRGFTLIELVITLAVAAILATIAVPDFETAVQNNRQVEQINALVEALNLARSTAIKEGGSWTATVCAGANTSCSDTNWADGWVVFSNASGGSPQLLRVFPALSGGNTLTNSGQLNGSGNSYTFDPSGLLANAGNDVYFVLCDARGATKARTMDLLPTGSIEAGQTPGYRIDGTTPLTCPGP